MYPACEKEMSPVGLGHGCVCCRLISQV